MTGSSLNDFSSGSLPNPDKTLYLKVVDAGLVMEPHRENTGSDDKDSMEPRNLIGRKGFQEIAGTA